MLYAVFCYHHEAEVMAWPREKDDAIIAKRLKVQAKYGAAGKLGPVARLMPTTAATTVRHGKEPLVIDGPFAETKEQLLGFYVVEGANLEDALAFAQELGEGETVTFEVRPLRYFTPGAKLA
jgi:hypothetical protein